MNRKKYKVLSIFMALILSLCALTFLTSAAEAPQLYQIYGDEMLFQQNKPITLAGTASPGTEIECALLLAGQTIYSALDYATDDGTFAVTLPGVPGGYLEYDLICKTQGVIFQTINNVVFGELWLASGQSNMQLPMDQSIEGKALIDQGKLGNKWVRYLYIPALPAYNGSTSNIPVNPQNDVDGVFWCNGTQSGVRSASAVGFFFAEKLQNEINMPVGLITAALGGSSIYTWIPRESIENDIAVLKDTQKSGVYYTVSQWNESSQNPYIDISGNYNNKIHPLRYLVPAGMIWYQGESNIGAEYGNYTRAFNLLQDSYGKLFGFTTDIRFPIVYTQLAPYDYGKNKFVLPQMHMEFAEIQKASPADRAMTTIYDVPLTYLPELHSIHPLSKGPTGEKMATAARSLLYDKVETYTAPYLDFVEIKDNAVYVRLNNVGDGLTVKQSDTYATPDPIYGCTIAGENKIFIEANAELVGPDTIRIWSPLVTNPKYAAYAYCETNTTANLFSTHNGSLVLGVAPFTTEHLTDASYMQAMDWTSCEIQSRWHCNDNTYSGDYPTWQASNANISFVEEDAYKGSASLQLDATSTRFTAAPTMLFNDTDSGLRKTFFDLDTDFSKFSTISFMIKNNCTQPLQLEKLNIYIHSNLWFTPKVNGSSDMGIFIPPDGAWHRVSLDLNDLYLFGKDKGLRGNRVDLKTISHIELNFSGVENASVLLDDFSFTPADSKATYNPLRLGSMIRFFFSIYQTIVNFINQTFFK